MFRFFFKKMFEKYQLTDRYWQNELTAGQYCFFEEHLLTNDVWETDFYECEQWHSLKMREEIVAIELLSAGYLDLKVIGDEDFFWKNKRVYTVKKNNPKIDQLRKKIRKDKSKFEKFMHHKGL